MNHNISYANRIEVIEDFIYDANRNIPVELICKAKDVRLYLEHILTNSTATLRYLDYDIDDIEGIDLNDEMSIEISNDEIWVAPLVLYSNEERKLLYSGDGCLEYVSSECDEFFFANKDAICVLKFTVED